MSAQLLEIVNGRIERLEEQVAGQSELRQGQASGSHERPQRGRRNVQEAYEAEEEENNAFDDDQISMAEYDFEGRRGGRVMRVGGRRGGFHPPNRARERDTVDGDLGSIKLKILAFQGRNDPELYLEWEKKVELVFDCHRYSEEKKVKLAAVVSIRQIEPEREIQ